MEDGNMEQGNIDVKNTENEKLDKQQNIEMEEEGKRISRPDWMLKVTDKGWAWLVAGASFVLNALVIGGGRCLGVMYVAFLNKFGGGAGKTAIFVSFCGGLIFLLAPVATSLGMQFGNRKVIMIGGMMVASGYLISAFAQSLEFLYFSYGIIVGTGSSLAFIPSMITLAQYFDKRLSLANGIAMAGSGIGSLILPLLIRILIDTYTLFGTLIIIAGVMLNICVCGSILRPMVANMPPSLRETKIKNPPVDEASVEFISSQNKEVNAEINDDVAKDCYEPENSDEELMTISLDPEEGLDTIKKALRSSQGDLIYYASVENLPNVEVNLPSQNMAHDKSGLMYKCRKSFKKLSKNNGNKAKIDFSLFKQPLFVLYFVSMFFSSFGYTSIFVMFPPFAQSIGLTGTQGALLISICGASDVLGRVVFGWFADLNYIKKTHGYIVVMTAAGCVSFAFPFMPPAFGWLGVIAALFGLLGGSFLALVPVLLTEAFGVKRLPSTFGLVNVSQGLGLMISVSFIGLLKDLTGSWDTSFVTCGISIIIGGLCIFMEPIAARLSSLQVDTFER